jgi:hypothetical protein
MNSEKSSENDILQNQEMLKIIQLSSQELLKLKGNDIFYSNKNNAEKFIKIISGQTQISIRLIDYFITKYSKYNKCNYKINNNGIENIFNIYYDYKNQLKQYQKIHFDPFSRGDRIPFFMNDSCILTTIGQLNFFRWFITKKIFEYLLEYKDNVFNEMNIKNKTEKKVTNITFNNLKKNKKIEIYKKPLLLSNVSDKINVNISVSF